MFILLYCIYFFLQRINEAVRRAVTREKKKQKYAARGRAGLRPITTPAIQAEYMHAPPVQPRYVHTTPVQPEYVHASPVQSGYVQALPLQPGYTG